MKRDGLFKTAATSLTVVPSVLHAMAPRRVACELPGGVVKKKTDTRHTKTRESTHTAWGKSKTDLVGEKGALFALAGICPE
jgi:hypothetical protein